MNRMSSNDSQGLTVIFFWYKLNTNRNKIQEQLQSQIELYDDKVADAIQKDETKGKLDQLLNEITSRVEKKIITQIKEYSDCIETSNGKAPILHLSNRQGQSQILCKLDLGCK